MRNFNINVLGSVQSVIGKQSYQLIKYLGRTRNENGYYISEFSDPIDMAGSVQPVKSSVYKDLGLDFKKAYIKIYDTELINSLTRETNSDQIIWNGYMWELAESTSWTIQSGWNFVLCVKTGKYEA